MPDSSTMSQPEPSTPFRRSGQGAMAPPCPGSMRPLLFAAMLAVFVLVRHHEVVRDLAGLLALDHALEQPLSVGLRRLDLDIGDLRRKYQELADQVLGAGELDDQRVV